MTAEDEPGAGVIRPTVLEARAISRAYPGVQALDDVSLRVREGEVVGLVGENGAGKSTLLSILSGSEQPSSGQVVVGGRVQALDGYSRANAAGVFRAHQDQGLVANLTVAENLFLGHEHHFATGGLLRRRRMIAAAAAQLERDEHLAGRVSPTDAVGGLPLDLRQLVEIARAFAVADLLGVGKPVVLLDETTASLDQDEVVELYGLIRSRRDTASFVFVSHRLNEVLDLCDRVYVLKDGRVVAERETASTDEAELHRLMVGRERQANHYLEDRRRDDVGPVALQVRGLTSEPWFRDVSLEVHRGEVLAIGGIAGCGKTALGRAVAGDIRSDGEVLVDGASLRSGRPSARVGRLAYGPLDRHAEGVSLLQSVRFNTTWSSLDSLRRGPFLDVRRERAVVQDAVRRYRIATPSTETRTGSLSGGNQQKVMLARLVASGARVLVLDNPTRGVDVGARQEIYGHLRDLADQGIAILVITDDLRELIGLGDRVAVMRDGRVSHEWSPDETRSLAEEHVVARMV